MSGKNSLLPFSPLYEPVIRDRYRDRYVAASAVRYAPWRGRDSVQGMVADDFDAQLAALESAGLYYARTDMVSLAVSAMVDGDVPDVAAPTDAGFLLLEGGVRAVGDTGPDAAMIYGLLWFPKGGELNVTMIPDVLFPPLGVRVPHVRDRGRVSVMHDGNAFLGRRVHGMGQDMALLRAMFALWAEPHVVTSSAPKVSPLDRVSKRVSEQAKRVRIVDVRERVDDAPERDPLGRKHRPYDHRFIVSGHWREQPCGHNRSERRRKWIAPYVKGPADRPLVLKDTVRVWRA